MMAVTGRVAAQEGVNWTKLPDLPDKEGFAGMYAGVSNDALLAMGGANFPGKRPWEGGKKQWYSDIYVLQNGAGWIKAREAMAAPAAYGISVSYKNQVIVVGGSNENGHFKSVKGYEWNGKSIAQTDYPDLPVPLANMGGGLLGSVVVVFGGSDSPGAMPLKRFYGLDLEDLSDGWQELEPWPGPGRIFPVCTFYNGQCYLFSGETTIENAKGEKSRHILADGYKLTLTKKPAGWSAGWEKLAPMPRGMSAGGSILPVLNNKFLFWGGVDAVTALYRDAATHPGISKSLLYYHPDTDAWEYLGEQTGIPSRVTLPVVCFENKWVYISGETRAGVRTPTVVSVH